MKVKETQRHWGDKKPFKVLRKFTTMCNKYNKPIKCAEVEADFWEGPLEEGQEGHYTRNTWVEKAGFWAISERTKELTFFPRKPTTCSFEGQLAAALK